MFRCESCDRLYRRSETVVLPMGTYQHPEREYRVCFRCYDSVKRPAWLRRADFTSKDYTNR